MEQGKIYYTEVGFSVLGELVQWHGCFVQLTAVVLVISGGGGGWMSEERLLFSVSSSAWLTVQLFSSAAC